MFTRVQEFRFIPKEKLPSIATLLDRISRQSEVDTNNDGITEEALVQEFQAYRIPLTYAFPAKMDHRLPRSFNEAIKNKNWCEAIDREFNALLKRKTWMYVSREPYMSPLPYTWIFRLKPLDL